VYSRSSADSLPRLYFYDSSITLSELDQMKGSGVQLVILSACETNAGTSYTGEGVFSMARGFASLGVPAVAATLWKADEQSIYELSYAFNKNLVAGLPKDEALQQAKIEYLRQHKNSELLPVYWANMILTGSSSPVIIAGSLAKGFG
jgi:CHAT domain-containing protein